LPLFLKLLFEWRKNIKHTRKKFDEIKNKFARSAQDYINFFKYATKIFSEWTGYMI